MQVLHKQNTLKEKDKNKHGYFPITKRKKGICCQKLENMKIYYFALNKQNNFW